MLGSQKWQCQECGRVTQIPSSVRIFVCSCGSRSHRLGDRTAYLLSYVGGNQFKRWYKKLTGKDCGCNKRQAWINFASARLTAWLTRYLPR